MNAQRHHTSKIPAEIMRLASRPEIRRSLCALKQFRVEAGLPEHLDELLEALDRAEHPAGRRHS